MTFLHSMSPPHVDSTLLFSVQRHLADKSPACAPTEAWWVTLLCVNSIAEVLKATEKKLQGKRTLLIQQEAELVRLMGSLSELCPVVQGPPPGEEADACATRGEFTARLSDAELFIKDQGTYAIDALTRMGGEEAAGVARCIGSMFAGLHDGISRVVAVRTSVNGASVEDLPPVLPHALAKIRTSELSEIMRPHRGRLKDVSPAPARRLTLLCLCLTRTPPRPAGPRNR